MVLFDLSLCQTSSPFLVSRFETVQIRCNSIRFFSKVSIEDSYGRLDINSSVLSFVWFKVEADVEVDKSSARVWPFGTRCLKFSAWLI